MHGGAFARSFRHLYLAQMIETSYSAMLLTTLLLIVSSLAGLRVSSLIPWSASASRAGIAFGFGLAIAPFLTGLLAVASLGLLPNNSHFTHLIFCFAALTLLALPYPKMAKPLPSPNWKFELQSNLWTALFGLLCLGWLVSLLYSSFFVPLTQNDALEYMTVGRNLFESRSIESYPALDSLTSKSGFYGPWTHPPLYVSMIYLLNCIQGHADFPGAARIIAPWFLVTSFFLLICLGRVRTQTTGYIAGLLYISSPLLMLGASSSLIDSLPVAGVVILITTMLHLQTTSLRFGLLNGFTLGLSLWTHSQAILFLPLWIGTQVLTGFEKSTTVVKATAAKITMAIATTILLAGWPYLRNYRIFGSPISDNPQVFALPKLNWPEYFEVARGYANLANRIQYGFFKGWFMIEAYSIIFWLLSFVLATALVQVLRSRNEMEQPWWRTLWTSSDLAHRTFVVFLAIYYAGVACSIAINVDLMIRNERYLLILIPPMALLAGAWIADLCESLRAKGTIQKITYGTLVVLLIALSLYQLKAVSSYGSRYGFENKDLLLSDRTKLESWPAFTAADFLAKSTPSDALVLSMKPADMYFSNRKMLSYLDPRMIPVYLEETTTETLRKLLELNVGYIHRPDYTLPPLHNSKIAELLSDKNLADLIFSEGGHQIYRLRSSPVDTPSPSPIDVGPKSTPWSRAQFAVLGGRKGLFRIPLGQSPLAPHGTSDSISQMPFFQREFTTIVFNGDDVPLSDGKTQSLIEVSGAKEVLLEIALVGHGSTVGIHILQFDKDGMIVEPYDSRMRSSLAGAVLDQFRIGEIMLPAIESPSTAPQTFQFRFKTQEDTKGIRLVFEHRGSSLIILNTVQVIH